MSSFSYTQDESKTKDINGPRRGKKLIAKTMGRTERAESHAAHLLRTRKEIENLLDSLKDHQYVMPLNFKATKNINKLEQYLWRVQIFCLFQKETKKKSLELDALYLEPINEEQEEEEHQDHHQQQHHDMSATTENDTDEEIQIHLDGMNEKIELKIEDEEEEEDDKGNNKTSDNKYSQEV